MIDQAVAHQQIPDQIPEGLLFQRQPVADGQGWQGGLQKGAAGDVVLQHLAQEGIVMQFEQNLSGKHLRLQGPQPFPPTFHQPR